MVLWCVIFDRLFQVLWLPFRASALEVVKKNDEMRAQKLFIQSATTDLRVFPSQYDSYADRSHELMFLSRDVSVKLSLEDPLMKNNSPRSLRW